MNLAETLQNRLVRESVHKVGSVKQSFGAIAQLVERFHGMEEARGSNPLSSTFEFGVISR